jgi:hypothetical protein
LVGEHLKELENERRQGIVNTGKEATLGAFAEYYLKQKRDSKKVTDWTLGGVQRSLERAVEFFGVAKPLASIHWKDVELWAEWLRKTYKGHRGNPRLSDGAVRHHLNALASSSKASTEAHRFIRGIISELSMGTLTKWVASIIGAILQARYVDFMSPRCRFHIMRMLVSDHLRLERERESTSSDTKPPFL